MGYSPLHMNIKLLKGELKSQKAGALVIGLFEGDKTNEWLQQCGSELVEEVHEALKQKEFLAEFGEFKSITSLGKFPVRRVLVAGLGKKKDFTLEKLRRISANAHKAVKASGARNYVSLLAHFGTFIHEQAIVAVAEGALLADYGFTEFKTEDREKLKEVESLILLEKGVVSAAWERALEKVCTASEAVNYVRTLVNKPANEVNPAYLAKEAEKLRKWMKVTVFGEKELRQKKFNGILAVGSGSANEPKLIVCEYNPRARKSIALVGKGITFDSGGLSLKPGKYMEGMKQDMAGAAVVLGVLKAATELKPNVRIIGVIPACENMPGGKSYRPDDIIRMYNGKTIEINNTDAEGRVILADALAYAESFRPQRIIDLATLTGACVVALGYWATGLLSKDDDMAKELEKAGQETGDRVWRLPLWEEYQENVKSDIADVRNCGKGYDAGTIEGAVFLSHFVKDTPWAHLDIAGTAFWQEEKFYNPKGATGAGVRLLLNYIGKL